MVVQGCWSLLEEAVDTIEGSFQHRPLVHCRCFILYCTCIWNLLWKGKPRGKKWRRTNIIRFNSSFQKSTNLKTWSDWTSNTCLFRLCKSLACKYQQSSILGHETHTPSCTNITVACFTSLSRKRFHFLAETSTASDGKLYSWWIITNVSHVSWKKTFSRQLFYDIWLSIVGHLETGLKEFCWHYSKENLVYIY